MSRIDSEQRTKILEAAIPVFAEKGLEGASIRLVGKAAGVNSALIYYYFEDKETLFTEAARTVVLGLLEKLQSTVRPFTSGEDRLAYLVNAIFDYYEEHPHRMRLMGVVFSLHPQVLGQILQGLALSVRLLPLDVLKEGMDQGELKRANPLQIWWGILGTCVFTLFMDKVVLHVNPAALPAKIPLPAEHRSQIIEIFSHGLGKDARGNQAQPEENVA